MAEPLSKAGSPRKASLETRQELLQVLGAPLGSVTIARRPTSEGDALVVRMTSPSLLPTDQRPDWFQGFPVTYEVVPPLKIGRP